MKFRARILASYSLEAGLPPIWDLKPTQERWRFDKKRVRFTNNQKDKYKERLFLDPNCAVRWTDGREYELQIQEFPLFYRIGIIGTAISEGFPNVRVDLQLTRWQRWRLKAVHKLLWIQKPEGLWVRNAILAVITGTVIAILSQFVGYKVGYNSGFKLGFADGQLAAPPPAPRDSVQYQK